MKVGSNLWAFIFKFKEQSVSNLCKAWFPLHCDSEQAKLQTLWINALSGVYAFKCKYTNLYALFMKTRIIISTDQHGFQMYCKPWFTLCSPVSTAFTHNFSPWHRQMFWGNTIPTFQIVFDFPFLTIYYFVTFFLFSSWKFWGFQGLLLAVFPYTRNSVL